MKREIKFRAWDTKVGEMFEVHELYLADNSNTFGKGILDEHNDFHPMDEIELMQFTGLLDKNGKKIFEGDVVRFWANPKDYGGYKGHNYIAAVEWDQAFLQFIFSDGHGLKDFEFLEVVGNIFKNPELLEG
jgi:uncharacterized phage protein (TIGR01671 family)